MVFCPSEVPWASAIIDPDTVCPRRNQPAAGSWSARSYLGLPGLTEGAPADFVVYPTDPRTDLSVLARPERIVLRGTVVR